VWLVTCDNRSFTFIHSIICTLIFFFFARNGTFYICFTIKEQILEVARRNDMLLMTKKNGGSLQCNPHGLAKICFLKKIVKDLLCDHSFIIICLMAGIQVVILSDDVPRVRRST